jgi:hypothetical protein
MPQARLNQFRVDTSRARDLVGLGQSIGAMTSGLVDASDLYRAAVTQAVAALDSYVHGVIMDRAVDILMNRLPSAGTDTKVGLHFDAVARIVNAPTAADAELMARGFVADRLTLETFQRPDDIGRGLAMVGIPKAWSTAFPTGPHPHTTALRLVVSRRNRIVHQCDADPLTPGQVTPLIAADALQSVYAVENVVNALDAIC